MGNGFFLKTGRQGRVGSLIHQGRTLIAAGMFSRIGESTPASNLARWDDNRWVPFPGNFNGPIERAFVYQGDLVVGGGFTAVDGAPAKFAARWNGGAWSPMGEGPDRRIIVFAEYAGQLFAGGLFTLAGGAHTGPVMRWDGASWTGLGSGLKGGDSWVMGLAGTEAGLYAGGSFTHAGGVASSRIARWTEAATPVRLAFFHAERRGAAAVLAWEIAGETEDHAGFHVYRDEGDRRMRLNDALLSGRRAYTFTDPAPPAEGAAYRLGEVGRDGTLAWHGPAAIGPAPDGTPVLHLGPSHPNPTAGATEIAFRLPAESRVRLRVFTLQGREVARLADLVLPAGEHRATWDGNGAHGRPAAAGVYLYRLDTPWGARTGKLTRL
jgi:hypothetical protein